MTRPGKKTRRKRESNPGSSAPEADALTTRRWCHMERIIRPPSIRFDHGSTSWLSCLFDCCSVACGCRDRCGRNNLCRKSRNCVSSLVCWSCCAPFCGSFFLLLCCHTEMKAAGRTCCLTRPRFTDTGPTRPITDPVTIGGWRGSHKVPVLKSLV